VTFEADGRQVDGVDRTYQFRFLVGTGAVQLTQVPPGDYVLQIVIADRLRKEKDRIAAQSIDFQVRQ
jgi:hypothetical protein